MKRIAFLFSAVLLINCFYACRNKDMAVPNSFDSIITVRLILQVKHDVFWHHVKFCSFLHGNSKFQTPFQEQDNSHILQAAIGDSMNIPVCADTVHYEFPLAISSKEPTDILIMPETPGYKSSGSFRHIVFTYFPASRKITSNIFPLNVIGFNTILNPNDTLIANTDANPGRLPNALSLQVRLE